MVIPVFFRRAALRTLSNHVVYPIVTPKTVVPLRNASLNSAIGRGIRKARSAVQSTEGSRPRFSRGDSYEEPQSNQRSFESRNNQRSFEPRNNQRSYESRNNQRNFESRSNQRSFESRNNQGDFKPRDRQDRRNGRDWVAEEQPRFAGRTSHGRPGLARKFPDDGSAGNSASPTKFSKAKRAEREAHIQDGSWSLGRTARKEKPKHHVLGRAGGNVLVPPTMPYTTPASEFIYGRGAVEAAIRCKRRQLYKLYIYQPVEQDLDQEQVTMQKLASSRGIPVKIAIGGWARLFDSVSNGRSHNGYVLEASPLPQLPIIGLESVEDPRSEKFRVALDVQSEEEIAVNGGDPFISRASVALDNYSDPTSSLSASSTESGARYPFLLLLDGVVDPNNVGSIIRSAYYLGVDGIIFAGRNSCPLNPVVNKTAAGAVENTTFLKVRNDHDFIKTSQANGWRFLAADSPEAAMQSGFYTDADTPDYAARSVLFDAPTVLMLGSEADGLLKRLKNQADATISIPGSRFRADLSLQDPARVDSLNVGVAASLLIEMLLRVPLQIFRNPSKQNASRTAELQATSTFEFN